MSISPTARHLFAASGSKATALVIPLQANIQARWADLSTITQVTAAAFIGDDVVVVGGTNEDANGVLLAMPVATLRALTFPNIEPLPPVPAFRRIVVNPNGTLVATYDDMERIRLWGVWQP
jgi:hypothetical protein